MFEKVIMIGMPFLTTSQGTAGASSNEVRLSMHTHQETAMPMSSAALCHLYNLYSKSLLQI